MDFERDNFDRVGVSDEPLMEDYPAVEEAKDKAPKSREVEVEHRLTDEERDEIVHESAQSLLEIARLADHTKSDLDNVRRDLRRRIKEIDALIRAEQTKSYKAARSYYDAGRITGEVYSRIERAADAEIDRLKDERYILEQSRDELKPGRKRAA